MQSDREEARLSASLAASQLLVVTSGAAGVEELARAAGISRRTWFRYFPAKEDCIRPMLREATTMTMQIVDDRLADEGVYGAFTAAFASVAGGLFAERTRGLLPVICASSSLSSVLEHEAVYTSAVLEKLLSRRLGSDLDPDTIAALSTVLPALANAALRDSVTNRQSPLELLNRRVQALRRTHLSLP